MLEDQSSGSLGAVWENKCFVGAGSKSKKDWLFPPLAWAVAFLVFRVCGKAGNGMSHATGVLELWSRIKWDGGLRKGAGFVC